MSSHTHEPTSGGALPFTIALRPYNPKLASGNLNVLDNSEAQAHAREVAAMAAKAATAAAASTALSKAVVADALPHTSLNVSSEHLEALALLASSNGPRQRHKLPRARTLETSSSTPTLQRSESPVLRKRRSMHSYD